MAMFLEAISNFGSATINIPLALLVDSSHTVFSTIGVAIPAVSAPHLASIGLFNHKAAEQVSKSIFESAGKTLTGHWIDCTGPYQSLYPQDVSVGWHRIRNHHFLTDALKAFQNPDLSVVDFYKHLGTDIVTKNGLPILPEECVRNLASLLGTTPTKIAPWISFNVLDTGASILAVSHTGSNIVSVMSGTAQWGVGYATNTFGAGALKVVAGMPTHNPILIGCGAADIACGAITAHQYTVSYRDIVRIADAIRSEGNKILELDSLPHQIDAGLKFACAALDPNKARAKENLKQGICGLNGGGGLAMAVVCFGKLMSPGILTKVAAFFIAGTPGGPLPVVGIIAGLVIAAGAVYAAFQKMSPSERSAKAHDCVMKGIDNWIEYGSKERPVSSQDIKEFMGQNATQHGLSPRDYQASFSLMMNVAYSDGILVKVERSVIELFLEGVEVEKRLNRSESIEKIKQLGTSKASEIVDWCFQVASADGVFHSREVAILKRYCQALGIDFDKKAKIYGL